MKKFLFFALFCALAANCDESGRADKISAAGKTTSIGETASARFIKSGKASAGSQSSADAVIQTDGISRADLQSCIVKSDEGSCERVARDETVNRGKRQINKIKRSRDESFKACAGGGAGA